MGFDFATRNGGNKDCNSIAFADLADEFEIGFSFAWMDIASLTEMETTIIDRNVTPSLLFFRRSQLVESAIEIGYTRVVEAMCRSNVLSWFGKTSVGATMIRNNAIALSLQELDRAYYIAFVRKNRLEPCVPPKSLVGCDFRPCFWR